jgi:hypothetical protein
VGCDVRDCCDDHKTCEVTHSVEQIGVAAIIGNFAGGPEIHMEDIERTTQRPREDKFAVAADGTIGGDTVWAFEDPISDVLAIEGPEKSKPDSMKCFINVHMAGSGGGVVSGEDSTAERGRNNNQHEQFFVVLDTLKDDQMVVDNSDAIAPNVITVSGMNRGERKGRERGF